MSQMNASFVWLKRALASVLVLMAGYGLAGVLQTASIHQGERQLWNANYWLSLALLAATGAALLLARSPAPDRFVLRAMPWVHAGLAGFFAWQVLQHLLAVDRCLDLGGSFDSLKAVCDMGSTHAFIPLLRSHGFPLLAATVFTLLALRARWRLSKARHRERLMP